MTRPRTWRWRPHSWACPARCAWEEVERVRPDPVSLARVGDLWVGTYPDGGTVEVPISAVDARLAATAGRRRDRL